MEEGGGGQGDNGGGAQFFFGTIWGALNGQKEGLGCRLTKSKKLSLAIVWYYV